MALWHLVGSRADAPTRLRGLGHVDHPIPIGQGPAHVWAPTCGSPLTPRGTNVAMDVGKLDVTDLKRLVSLADPLPLRARIQIADRDHQLRPLAVASAGQAFATPASQRRS